MSMSLVGLISMMMETQSNKTITAGFYKQVIGKRDASLIPVLVHENYIQHSASAKDGREGLEEMVAFLKTTPQPKNAASPIKMLIADDDLVAGLMDIKFMGKHMLVIDLFRLRNGMLAEHWDATQEVSKEFRLNAIDINPGDVPANKAFIQGLFKTDSLLKEMYYNDNDATIMLVRIIGEGDLVLTQSRLTIQGQDYAQYDVFRVGSMEITEHWGIRQKFPEKMLHSNGML